MPPFAVVDRETLGLHRAAQQVARGALLRRAPGEIRVGALRKIVIPARHGHLEAGPQVVQREVDRAAAIVARALRRVSHEPALVRRRRVPEHLGHVPGPVSVEQPEAVTVWAERSVGADQGLGRGPLQEHARFRVDRGAHEVVGAGVAHIELQRGIERHHFHQIVGTKLAGFLGRHRAQRIRAQLLESGRREGGCRGCRARNQQGHARAERRATQERTAASIQPASHAGITANSPSSSPTRVPEHSSTLRTTMRPMRPRRNVESNLAQAASQAGASQASDPVPFPERVSAFPSSGNGTGSDAIGD